MTVVWRLWVVIRRKQAPALPWRAVGIVLAYLGAVLAIMVIANTRTPVMQVRYFIVFLPAVLVLIAIGIGGPTASAPWPYRILLYALPAMALNTWVPEYRTYKKQGWREAVAWSLDLAKPGYRFASLGPPKRHAVEYLEEGNLGAFYRVRNHDFFAYYLGRVGRRRCSFGADSTDTTKVVVPRRFAVTCRLVYFFSLGTT